MTPQLEDTFENKDMTSLWLSLPKPKATPVMTAKFCKLRMKVKMFFCKSLPSSTSLCPQETNWLQCKFLEVGANLSRKELSSLKT